MVRVKYSDFIKIFQISPNQLNDWGPGLEVRSDGLYVKDPKKYTGFFLTPEELSILTSHPTGDLSKPALSFPCSKEELIDFINFYGFNDYYDPEVLMGIPDDEPEITKQQQKTSPAIPHTLQHNIDSQDFIRKLQMSLCSDNSIFLKPHNGQVREFSCYQMGFKPNSKGWGLLMEILWDKYHFFYVGIYNRYNTDSGANRDYNNRQQRLNHFCQKFREFLNKEFKINIPSDFKLFENQKGIERDGIYKPKFQIVTSFKNASNIKEMSKDDVLNKIKMLSKERRREKNGHKQEELLVEIGNLAAHAAKMGWITRQQLETYITIPDEEYQSSSYDALSYSEPIDSVEDFI